MELKMCTAISYGNYAGRNLDVDMDYGEKIIITPRSFTCNFKSISPTKEHYAIIGMGIVKNGYPLYFDAANENGLYVAGLNYIGNAKYMPVTNGKVNIAPYEFIPYLLSRCATVKESEYELERISITNIPFSRDLPCAELHYFIADKSTSIVVEPDATGIKVYKNPTGVLTNNPPFPIQLFNLNNYINLSSESPDNRFSTSLDLKRYSFGMGAIGLPGDLSSASRFVRATFHRANSNGSGTLADIMHLLSSVSMPNGSVRLGCRFERTEYTSAIDLSRLVYSYKTYDSPNTYSVNPEYENLNSDTLITHELKREKEPFCTNSPYPGKISNKI